MSKIGNIFIWIGEKFLQYQCNRTIKKRNKGKDVYICEVCKRKFIKF